MVGWAMNASFTEQPPVPAHRVVNRLGVLSGKMHFPSPETMQNRLEQEGVIIENDRLKDFQKHFWDPNLELEIDAD
jgi:methylated-DNA-protein-cysteine methyltransferase-like protein